MHRQTSATQRRHPRTHPADRKWDSRLSYLQAERNSSGLVKEDLTGRQMRSVMVLKNHHSIVVFWDWESARHVATFEQYVTRITTRTKMSSIKSKCSLDLKSHFRNHRWRLTVFYMFTGYTTAVLVKWNCCFSDVSIKLDPRERSHFSHLGAGQNVCVTTGHHAALTADSDTQHQRRQQLVWATRGFTWLNIFVFTC